MVSLLFYTTVALLGVISSVSVISAAAASTLVSLSIADQARAEQRGLPSPPRSPREFQKERCLESDSPSFRSSSVDSPL